MGRARSQASQAQQAGPCPGTKQGWCEAPGSKQGWELPAEVARTVMEQEQAMMQTAELILFDFSPFSGCFKKNHSLLISLQSSQVYSKMTHSVTEGEGTICYMCRKRPMR